jgi:hypothetical protein
MKDDSFLLRGFCYLLTVLILEQATRKTILLHNCDWRRVENIQATASRSHKAVKVVTSAFVTNHRLKVPHIVLHPHATKAQITAALPSRLDVFVDFTPPNTAETASSESVIRSLSDQCTVVRLSDIVSSESTVPAFWDSHQIPDQLRSIAELDCDQDSHQWQHGDLETGSIFTCTAPAEQSNALIQRLNPATLFGPERTYFLCGLTGEIGRSICSWMVKNGARYVVLASRSPNLDRSLCVPLERLGAKLVILPVDSCDQSALNKAIEELRTALPPIAGVAHGAMVLSDATFANMTMGDMQRVLHPKVVGSINLDKAFEFDKLDFFIMFSSLSCIVGNIGQSNYAAANMVS